MFRDELRVKAERSEGARSRAGGTRAQSVAWVALLGDVCAQGSTRRPDGRQDDGVFAVHHALLESHQQPIGGKADEGGLLGLIPAARRAGPGGNEDGAQL